MAFNISYIYEVLDRYSAPLQKISQATSRFEQAAERAQNKVRALGARMEEAGGRMANFRSAIGAGGIIASLKAVVGQSSAVEDAMGDVRRVMDFASEGEFAQFDAMLTQMSETMGRSKEALASIAYEGGKLGVASGEIGSFIDLVAGAAISFDMLDEEAGRSIGSIRAKLSLGNDAVKGLLDSVNYLADSTSADGAQMIEIIERASGAFSQLKIPPQVSAGFAAFANQIEVTEELAASGLNMMFARMGKSPAMVKKLLADPIGGVRETLESLAKMSEEARMANAYKMFGDEAGRFVLKAASKIELFGDTMEKALGDKAVGSMGREVENVLRRSSTGFKGFQEVLKNTAEDIGDIIKPSAVAMFNKLGDAVVYVREKLINANPQLVKVATAVLALIAGMAGIGVVAGVAISALGAIATLVGAITWPIALAVGAVAALAAVFAYWTSVGHPVIDVLKETGAAVWDAISAIFGMSGAVTGGAGAWDIFLYVLDRVGDALSVVLHAVKFVAQGIRSLAEAVGLLLQGEFSAAWKALEKGGDDMMGSLSGMLSDAGSMVGLVERASKAAAPGGPIPSNVSTLAQASATRESGASVNNVAVDGRIRVEAERGARVTESSITLNRGQNLAYGN